MKRVLWGLGIGGALAVGACVLLPERYAVNAPLDHLLLGRSRGAPDPGTLEARIRAPEGFAVALWAEGLPGARFLRFTPTGDLLVSRPRAGRVDLLRPDADGDGRSDGARALLEGLDRPHGLDLHEGWLYVAEHGAVARVPFEAAEGTVGGEVERVVADLPTGGNHWTRTLRFGPDGALYVSVGSSCNVCIEEDPRRAALLRYRPDGSGEQIFARGLRNAVGFDWHPETGALYATDNGRDLLGDDFPPCELNRVREGHHYGWPFVNGFGVPDPDFGGHPAAPADPTPPAHGFGAHQAPLGITFVAGETPPPGFRHAALVALHGSWNRSEKAGYKVVSLHWDGDAVSERDFLWGFERDGDVIGRPVDVAQGPDGAFYVSDDYAGAIYRVAWVGDGTAARGPAAAAAPRRAVDPLATLGTAERRQRSGRGASLFAAHECGSCHGQGTPPPGMVPKPLEGLAARHDLASLEALLATPTPPMPVFPLTDGERRDLAVYLLERHP